MGLVAVKCPDCGADIQLDDSREFGFCNYCGAKVVQDKIVVEHRGSVQLDESDAVQKLYQAARNAWEIGDDATALKHYESLTAKDPNGWEPLFYTVILQINSITNAEISDAALRISNCLPKVFQLIKTYVPAEDKKDAIVDVANTCDTAAEWLLETSFHYYDSITESAGAMALTGIGGMAVCANTSKEALQTEIKRCLNIVNIMCHCGNYIESMFDMQDSDYQRYAVFGWKKMIGYNEEFRKKHKFDLLSDDSLTKFSSKIHQYDPSYEVRGKTKSKGCYVATCVYGSYDCPQVWTLRRYRDDTLAATWYGRAFIRTYYAVSPTLVAWFGHTDWFKNLWRGKLDRMVDALQKDGVEDTPYDDNPW